MKKTLIAAALICLFTASISASAFNPLYIPESKEAYLQSELRYYSAQTDTGETSNSRDIDIFGGNWGDSFNFGYGLSNRVTLRIAKTPINNIYNLVGAYDSNPALGITYRAINSGLKLDFLGDWGIALSKHQAEDYDGSTREEVYEESNAFHIATRLGKKGETLSFAGTAGVIYITSRESEYSGNPPWDSLKKYDSRTDYYLKFDGYFNLDEKLNLGGKFVYSQIGEQKYERTGFSPSSTIYYEDQEPHMYFEFSGDYQLKENVNIETFIGYSPEVKTGTSSDNNDFVNAGIRFAFKL